MTREAEANDLQRDRPVLGPVFALCSGGCGSRYLVELLRANGYPDAFHEKAPDLDRLGVAYHLGAADRPTAVERLAQTRAGVAFEASNRLFALASPLREAFPTSVFIHLHRDPAESVRSIWSNPDIDEIVRMRRRFVEIVGPAAAETSTLDRICRYWAEINRRILSDLEAVGGPWLSLSFDDLVAGEVDALEAFLRWPLPIRRIAPQNEKPRLRERRRPPAAEWTAAERATLRARCGDLAAALGYASIPD
ncbi:MAG: hypothetical protein AAGF90_09635 [Pseudomonadota bacterium]